MSLATHPDIKGRRESRFARYGPNREREKTISSGLTTEGNRRRWNNYRLARAGRGWDEISNFCVLSCDDIFFPPIEPFFRWHRGEEASATATARRQKRKEKTGETVSRASARETVNPTKRTLPR